MLRKEDICMKTGDRVLVDTKGRLKWADGATATVQNIVKHDGEADTLIVQIDGLEISMPHFGIMMISAKEAELIAEKQEEPQVTNDPVNHPNHYTDGKYECIDYMESQGYTRDGYLFNAVKYISRAGKKDPGKYEEDIQKAIWYLKRKIEKAGTIYKGIQTKDYINDKGLEGTLSGLALEMIEKNECDAAIKLLQMELAYAHKKHSS